MKLLLIIFILFMLIGCANKKQTYKILHDQGYYNVKILGYTPVGCSSNDLYHTRFVGNAANGGRRVGVVCTDAFKNSYVKISG